MSVWIHCDREGCANAYKPERPGLSGLLKNWVQKEGEHLCPKCVDEINKQINESMDYLAKFGLETLARK